ncbi:MAG: VOC family protein, partial [Candidatus Eisenbacteria bacterium]
MPRFDHAVVVVPSLAWAVPAFESAGFTVRPGGRHDAVPTENALVCFADGGYLELLATREPGTRDDLRTLRASHRWEAHLRGVSAIARRFLPLLAGADGVADWVLRSDGIARDAARLRAAGLVVSGPVAMSRERPDGERLDWQLLLPESALHPFRIEDRTPRSRRVPADDSSVRHANGARGVAVVHVRAPIVPLAALELGGTLGVTPAVRADGATALDLGDWSVQLTEGEPPGAFGVTIVGVGELPGTLTALGIRVLPG